jgi:hypothetical protein
MRAKGEHIVTVKAAHEGAALKVALKGHLR